MLTFLDFAVVFAAGYGVAWLQYRIKFATIRAELAKIEGTVEAEVRAAIAAIRAKL